jgi:hypothetical protein
MARCPPCWFACLTGDGIGSTEGPIVGDEKELSGEVSAEAWFDHWSASDHWIREHSIKIWDGLVLSLLWWTGDAEQMLIRIDDYEERRDASRSDDYRRR